MILEILKSQSHGIIARNFVEVNTVFFHQIIEKIVAFFADGHVNIWLNFEKYYPEALKSKMLFLNFFQKKTPQYKLPFKNQQSARKHFEIQESFFL